MKLHVDPDTPHEQGSRQFELDGWIDRAPFEALVGLHIERAEGGEALLTMPFTVKLANGGGVMHGGAMTTLADTAVAMAVKSLLPQGATFATTELSMQFLAPVRSGTLSAHARVSRSGERLFHGECELRGAGDELHARFTCVFKMARRSSDGEGG